MRVSKLAKGRPILRVMAIVLYLHSLPQQLLFLAMGAAENKKSRRAATKLRCKGTRIGQCQESNFGACALTYVHHPDQVTNRALRSYIPLARNLKPRSASCTKRPINGLQYTRTHRKCPRITLAFSRIQKRV